MQQLMDGTAFEPPNQGSGFSATIEQTAVAGGDWEREGMSGTASIDREAEETAATLCIIANQLHASLQRADVLQTINEILLNLVGVQRFGIYEFTSADVLGLVEGLGLDFERHRSIRLTGTAVGAAAASSTSYYRRAPEAGEVLALIPMRVGRELVGAIVLHELLAHKPALDATDQQLLEFVGLHGAAALYLATLHGSRRSLTSSPD